MRPLWEKGCILERFNGKTYEKVRVLPSSEADDTLKLEELLFGNVHTDPRESTYLRALQSVGVEDIYGEWKYHKSSYNCSCFIPEIISLEPNQEDMEKSTKFSSEFDRTEVQWGSQAFELTLDRKSDGGRWVQHDPESVTKHVCCAPCRAVEGFWECSCLPCCYFLSRCFHDIKRSFFVSGKLLVVYDHQSGKWISYRKQDQKLSV